MRTVLAHIDAHKARLEAHPFFARLAPDADIGRALGFAPAATFWVLTFQDLLRLNLDRATDPAIRRILEGHLAEDSGHERWFLEDVAVITGAAPPDPFSARLLPVREVSFALASEVYRVEDDRLRVALLEVLEAAAAVFFGRVSAIARASGHADRLTYFAGLHLHAEAAHEMHADEGADVCAIVIPEALRADALALVDRMFGAFGRFADALLAELHRTAPPRRTFRELGHERLSALCRASGLAACEREALGLLDVFMDGWGDRPIEAAAAWASDITDDHTPFELSLALVDGRPELRFLIEAQGPGAPGAATSWAAGRAVNERLEREFGVSLDRFRRIEDLFVPADPGARFALWHAISLRPGEAPEFKVYLNPRARGAKLADATVRDALARLGLEGAWGWLAENVLQPARDPVVYFSLDLAAHGAARVKVYVAHPGITAQELDDRAGLVPGGLLPGETTRFCRTLAGHDGPYDDRAPDTCYAFTAARADGPTSVTVYMPVRGYVPDDQVGAERMSTFLAPAERGLWGRVLGAVAGRPLDAGRGLVQWASLQHRGGARRVTVYLTPEAYSALPVRPAAASPAAAA